VEVAISNSFGFGGHNVTLVFKKYIWSMIELAIKLIPNFLKNLPFKLS
jgi:hypothetical protein